MKAKKTPQGWAVKESRYTWGPMEEDTTILSKKPVWSHIAQVPSAGYIQRDTFSKASIQWLEYQMELARREGQTLDIQHALNGGEVPILGTKYKVDGRSDRTVYEYHGKCD